VTDAGSKGAAPNTGDMLRVHTVFRDAITTSPMLIGGVADANAERAAFVGSYYFNVLELLKVHHDGEDQFVTPLLIERCGTADADVARLIADQHKDVHEPLENAQAAVQAWADSAASPAGTDAVNAVQALGQALFAHLDREEAEILPLVEANLTVEEWAVLPAHGMQHFGGDNPWLIVGLLREDMTDDELAAMDAAMPPPVVEAWYAAGEGAFTTFVSELRST
jgi:Hemerythrin HHE cation binding domain